MNPIYRLSLLISGVLYCIIICTSSIAYSGQFIPLGDLPGGIFSSNATSVDASGTVVVGSSSSDSPISQGGAFIWTEAGGMVGIGDGAFAESVSNDGSTAVGGISDGAMITPYVWNISSGPTSLGLPAGETPNGTSVALDVSGDGSVVVGSTQFGGLHQAFRWTTATDFVSLAGDLPGTGTPSLATAVSDDGEVIVGGFFNGENRAFRWTSSSGATDLGDLPGGDVNTLATDTSANGNWVVGTASSAVSPVEAFLWSEATGMIGIGFPSPAETTPFAVTDDGRAVVGRSDVIGVSAEAFVWIDGEGIQQLQGVLASRFGLGSQLAGWTLNSATDISADGRSIVGTGVNPNGNQEGWLVRLDQPIFIPEPGAFFLSVICLACFACYYRPVR